MFLPATKWPTLKFASQTGKHSRALILMLQLLGVQLQCTEQCTVVNSKGGNFPRHTQLVFIVPYWQPHQRFSSWILQWALLPFGPQSCIVWLSTEL